MKYFTCFMLLVTLLFFSCVTPDKTTTEPEKKEQKAKEEVDVSKLIQVDIPSLKEVLKDDFLIGAALDPQWINKPAHAALLKKHFSSITAENCMKPDALQPREGKFTFRTGDILAEFTKENNIGLRGHCLVWHAQVGAWMFEENGKLASKETLKKRMKTHITTVMKHYKGQVYAWDVVNEAISVGAKDNMRQSKWYQILGKEYVELAFRYAHEADPDAKLFYNDYGLSAPDKRDAVVAMVKELQDKGVHIDGIGMQMHSSIFSPILDYFERALAAFSELGVEVHITELDISVYNDSSQRYETVSDELLTAQGWRVKDLFDVLRKYKDSVTSVTFWGIADDYSWKQRFPVKRNEWPLLFDENLKAKPAYWGIVDPSKLGIRINSARAVQSTPEIDGKIDDAWEFIEIVPAIPALPDLSCEVKLLWDENYLYTLADVTDKTPVMDDSITLFIDEKNERSEAMDDNDSIIKFTLDKSWKNSKDATVMKRGDGYVFEARVPFKKIKGKAGMKLGLDFSITSGNDAVIKWNHKEVLESTSPNYWGMLTCDSAPKGKIVYEGTAVIDAEKDAAYNKGSIFPVDLYILGIVGEEIQFEGATAKAWVLWAGNGLSVYMEVTDSILSDINDADYMQDSVEVFIDENNNKTVSYEKDDAQYRVNFKNKQSFGSTGNFKGFKSAAKIVSGGYVVEVFIPFRTITATAGDILGFDLQVNDDQGTGKRDSIAKWNDPSNDSWQSTSKFGVIMLKE